MSRHSFILALLICLAIPITTLANGVYIPQQAYPTLPTIPAQRAIIIHRNGVETLIVESAFQTASPDVAWILPLPAAPTKLELADPGIITSACTALHPDITNDLHGLWQIPLVLFLIILPFALNIVYTAGRKRRHSRYVSIFAIETLIALFFAILLPSLGGAGGSFSLSSTPGVNIRSAQRLGDYQVIVLTAPDPSELSKWLAAQSLKPLDSAAQPLIADYISRGWCFVVTQLHRDSPGFSVPCPLVAAFPTATAVFPMKLTALANTTTHVELCIIADQQAAAPLFHCQAADRFEPSQKGDASLSPFFYAPIAGLRMGSPDISARMWNNCVVTQLIADLRPADMSHDISLTLQPLIPQRDHFFTSLSRRQIILTILLALPLFCTIIAAVIYRGRRKPTGIQRRLLIDTAGVILLAAVATWFLLPTIPVHTSSRSRLWLQSNQLHNAFELHYARAAEHSLRPDLSPAGIAAMPQDLLDEGYSRQFLSNPFTGELIRHERSPGNFDLRTIDSQLQFCTYDIDGIETHTPLELPPAPSPQTRP